MMPQPTPHIPKMTSAKPQQAAPAASLPTQYHSHLHHHPYPLPVDSLPQYAHSSTPLEPPMSMTAPPSTEMVDDELLIFIVNSLLNSDRVRLRTTVTSFFHPDARLINPLVRVQGREMVYRLYRCATVFNHPRAAVHKVYRSRDGESAMDITIHITPKWLPITIRVPFVVIIRFRMMLDRPLIIEQYDHYGPILALPCTVPGVQLLLESVVQPLVGLGITTLAWAVDVMEDVVQYVQLRVQKAVKFQRQVTHWVHQEFIAPLQHQRKVQQMRKMAQSEKEQQHLLSQAAKLEQLERFEQENLKWLEHQKMRDQERVAQMQQQAEALAAANASRDPARTLLQQVE